MISAKSRIKYKQIICNYNEFAAEEIPDQIKIK